MRDEKNADAVIFQCGSKKLENKPSDGLALQDYFIGTFTPSQLSTRGAVTLKSPLMKVAFACFGSMACVILFLE